MTNVLFFQKKCYIYLDWPREKLGRCYFKISGMKEVT